MGKAGSDLTLDTADAIIVRDELVTVPAVIALSRRASRLVMANLIIAAMFITGLVIWDLAGHLPLPLGVAGHEGSTVLVGLNGLRLLHPAAWRRASIRYCPLSGGQWSGLLRGRGLARTWMRSPWPPKRLRISTGPSPVRPNQCGSRVSNSAASPVPRTRP